MGLTIDNHIQNIDEVICRNIDMYNGSDTGLLFTNILAQLRNFVEHIALKEFGNGTEITNSYDNIKLALSFIKSKGQLRFLMRFHKGLQVSASHYTWDDEKSERLMLKYYEYLIKIKNYFKQKYKIQLLRNLDLIPIYKDSSLREYYQKISQELDKSSYNNGRAKKGDRFYITKVKPFFIDSKIYYEITFTRAHDRVNKFDRTIAFTQLDILPNYAVKLSFTNASIEIVGNNMPIKVIDDWEVSIRTCELNNFADILGEHPKLGGTKEIYELMSILKKGKLNLVDLIDLDDTSFGNLKKHMAGISNVPHFFKILERCRQASQKSLSGTNVMRYLLFRLNNRVIKKQRSRYQCELLSNLYLNMGCIPFDKMPFCTFPINHITILNDLLECFDPEPRKHELFARYLTSNTESKGMLFTPIESIVGNENIENLITKFNDNIYYKHTGRRIEKYKDHLYINGYENASHEIICKLKELNQGGIHNYRNSVMSWLNSSTHDVDSPEKSEALSRLFENSNVALIYGAAGTGKSHMINHIASFFNNEKKLFIANTNPAVDNLKRRVTAANSDFMTIAKFLLKPEIEHDILVIDECSTVSNRNMLNILNVASFNLLVLVGDTYQIESIRFGNWFSLANSFVSSDAIFELIKPFRSQSEDLLEYWDRVRNIEENILELSTTRGYSVSLDESIFSAMESDEIILCLNYDGLYGINNINRFLQNSNPNNPVEWGVHTYKVNDPILFTENDRFSPLLYNNLKGKIVDISIEDSQIRFDVSIDTVINGFQAQFYDLELLESTDSKKSVVRFMVDKYVNPDEDDSSSDALIPFQIAYAVSIHKAQGLEYDSVKVVISDEVEERITHNIFYTAITRARKKLRIYWTPETEHKILSNLKARFNRLDYSLLKSKNSIN